MKKIKNVVKKRTRNRPVKFGGFRGKTGDF